MYHLGQALSTSDKVLPIQGQRGSVTHQNEHGERKGGNTMTPARKRLLIVILLVALAGVTTAILWPIVREPPRSTIPKPTELPQYYVLSATNGILKQYLVVEGERIKQDASLALVCDADYEQRVRNARAAVAHARLALEEARLEAITPDRTTAAGGSRIAARDRSQAKRDEQAIRNHEQAVRQLDIAVASAQAKLAEHRSQPFGSQEDARAIAATEADLARLQGKRDVADIELKRVRERAETRMGEAGGAAAIPIESTAVNRRINAAAEALKHKQEALSAVVEDAAAFTSTIPAPFGGQIIRLLHPKGSFIREGQPLVVIMQQP